MTKKAGIFRNALVSKPWENQKCPNQSLLFLNGPVLSPALGTFRVMAAMVTTAASDIYHESGSTLFSTRRCSRCILLLTHCVWRRCSKNVALVKWCTVSRSSFFRNITPHWLELSYRRFGKACRYHLQETSNPGKIFLDYEYVVYAAAEVWNRVLQTLLKRDIYALVTSRVFKKWSQKGVT